MFRVWRVRKDSHGETIFDSNDEPIYDIVKQKVALTMDNLPVMNSDGSFQFEMTEWVNFGYRTSGKNTSDTADVAVSDYKLATVPLLTHIEPGDRVELKDYTRTYWGEVVKMTTFNLGSNIWINEVKN